MSGEHYGNRKSTSSQDTVQFLFRPMGQGTIGVFFDGNFHLKKLCISHFCPCIFKIFISNDNLTRRAFANANSTLFDTDCQPMPPEDFYVKTFINV